MKTFFAFWAKPLPPTLLAINFDLVDRHGNTIITLSGINVGNPSSIAIKKSGVTTLCTLPGSTSNAIAFATTPNAAAGVYDVIITTAGGVSTLPACLELWYPDQMARIFGVYDVGIGMTVDGSGNCSAWADQSGNGNHLTSVLGDRPAYVLNAFGARPVARFDITGNHEFRLSAHNSEPAGFFHATVGKSTSLNGYGANDYNVGCVLWSNYGLGNLAYNTSGTTLGYQDYVQYTGVFLHDQKNILINDNTVRCPGVWHSQATNEVKQYLMAVQTLPTVSRAYNVAGNGWESLGNSDGSGWIGDMAFAISITGDPDAADLVKWGKFCLASFYYQASPPVRFALDSNGDSITDGYMNVLPVDKSQAYPERAQVVMGGSYSVVNRGLIGYRIDEIVTNWIGTGAASLSTAVPNIVTCMAGRNNIFDVVNNTAGFIEAQIQDWYDAVKTDLDANTVATGHPNYQIWVSMCSIDGTAGQNAVWTAVEAWIQSNWRSIGFNALCDVGADSRIGGLPLNTTYFQPDKVHLNVAGQIIAGDLLVDQLQGLGLV